MKHPHVEALNKEERFFKGVLSEIRGWIFTTWKIGKGITVIRSVGRESPGVAAYLTIPDTNKMLFVGITAEEDPASNRYTISAELIDKKNKKGVHPKESFVVELSGSAEGKLAEARGVFLNVLTLLRNSYNDESQKSMGERLGRIRKMFG